MLPMNCLCCCAHQSYSKRNRSGLRCNSSHGWSRYVGDGPLICGMSPSGACKESAAHLTGIPRIVRISFTSVFSTRFCRCTSVARQSHFGHNQHLLFLLHCERFIPCGGGKNV